MRSRLSSRPFFSGLAFAQLTRPITMIMITIIAAALSGALRQEQVIVLVPITKTTSAAVAPFPLGERRRGRRSGGSAGRVVAVACQQRRSSARLLPQGERMRRRLLLVLFLLAHEAHRRRHEGGGAVVRMW
jgi:hypothetical protein